jgi:Protein of unknown function (DUF5132)
MVWRVLTKALASPKTMFFVGAASAAVLKAVAPVLGSVARPLLREAVKGGLLIGRQVQAAVQEAWQEVEDITAEAKAEMDQPQNGERPANGEHSANGEHPAS